MTTEERAEAYFTKEYGGLDHIISVCELEDRVSIKGLLAEFARSEVQAFANKVKVQIKICQEPNQINALAPANMGLGWALGIIDELLKEQENA